MASPTLAKMVESPTEKTLIGGVLAWLGVQGFPITAWLAGEPTLVLIEALARLQLDTYKLISTLAKAGFSGYASGDWLTLLGEQFYGTPRQFATPAIHLIAFTLAPLTSDLSVSSIGQIVIKDLAGREYFNVSTGTLKVSQNGTPDNTLQFKSSGVGVLYNAANNSITTMVTTFAGVSVASSTLDTQAKDDETDDKYATRLRGKWGSVGIEPNVKGFDYLIRTNFETITRTKIYALSSQPRKVFFRLAGPNGPSTSGEATSVEGFLVDYKMPNVDHDVAPANPVTIFVEANVVVKPGYPNAKAQIIDRLTQYFATLAIGESVIRSQIIEEIQVVAGVYDTNLISPSSNVTIGSDSVPILSHNIEVYL